MSLPAVTRLHEMTPDEASELTWQKQRYSLAAASSTAAVGRRQVRCRYAGHAARRPTERGAVADPDRPSRVPGLPLPFLIPGGCSRHRGCASDEGRGREERGEMSPSRSQVSIHVAQHFTCTHWALINERREVRQPLHRASTAGVSSYRGHLTE